MYLGVTDERTTESQRRLCAHVEGKSMLDTKRNQVVNALSIDVEDYFHVGAFEHVIKRSQWETYPLRVGENTRRVLDLFDEFEVKGTFLFSGGWLNETQTWSGELPMPGMKSRVTGMVINWYLKLGLKPSKRTLPAQKVSLRIFAESRCADTALPAIQSQQILFGHWIYLLVKGLNTIQVSSQYTMMCMVSPAHLDSHTRSSVPPEVLLNFQ